MNDESIPKELTSEEIWIDTNTTPFEDHFDVMSMNLLLTIPHLP